MYWPIITKNTPLEEVRRIHQLIWDYVIEHGEKPDTPYISNCAACQYVIYHEDYGERRCYDICPIAWKERPLNRYDYCFKLFYDWTDIKGYDLGFVSDLSTRSVTEYRIKIKELAKQIRDIPFKYEVVKGEKEID